MFDHIWMQFFLALLSSKVCSKRKSKKPKKLKSHLELIFFHLGRVAKWIKALWSNWKVLSSGSNPTRHSTWFTNFKLQIVRTQWLILDVGACCHNNGPITKVGQPNWKIKKLHNLSGNLSIPRCSVIYTSCSKKLQFSCFALLLIWPVIFWPKLLSYFKT